MNRKELFNEVKKDRGLLRRHIRQKIANQVCLAAKSEHFPNFDILINSISDEIALMMDHFPDVPSQYWSVLLQASEPDMTCPRFEKLMEEYGDKV